MFQLGYAYSDGSFLSWCIFCLTINILFIWRVTSDPYRSPPHPPPPASCVLSGPFSTLYWLHALRMGGWVYMSVECVCVYIPINKLVLRQHTHGSGLFKKKKTSSFPDTSSLVHSPKGCCMLECKYQSFSNL